MQKFINFWFSYCLDLFGSEISTNASDFFATGLKGRFNEEKRYSEHSALNQTKTILMPRSGQLVNEEVELRTAMNECLREDYVDDCQNAIRRWSKAVAAEGVNFEVTLPSPRFHRHQGIYADMTFDLAGNPISADEFERRKADWLPSTTDLAYLRSIMQPVTEPGKIANWIAPPKKGINNNEFAFEYVKL